MWHKRGYVRFSTKPQAIKIGKFVILIFFEKFFKIWHESELFIIGKIFWVCIILYLQ